MQNLRVVVFSNRPRRVERAWACRFDIGRIGED
jgi:hypothetical protein